MTIVGVLTQELHAGKSNTMRENGPLENDRS